MWLANLGACNIGLPMLELGVLSLDWGPAVVDFQSGGHSLSRNSSLQSSRRGSDTTVVEDWTRRGAEGPAKFFIGFVMCFHRLRHNYETHGICVQ